jgi:pimeloyl-ACP methyl ester carboxylesterase
MEIEKLSLQANGFQFDGLAAGPKGAPLILCLHGFPQFADSWIKILPVLGEAGYRAVAVDQRGYSKRASPKKVSDYELGALIDDTLKFSEALGEEKFHLVGHDWGGIIAWKLAADEPDRLLSVTVVSTPHLDAFREALLTTFDQVLKSSYVAVFKAPFHLAEKLLKANDWKILRKLYLGKVDRDQIERNIERFSDGRTLTNALNWYRAFSFVGRTGTIDVPTLYIWGSHDQALGPAAASSTGKFVDAAYRFERIESGSHWLLDEKPELVAKLILDHVKQQQKETL